MYFISKICVLCLNTNQVTQILENNTYKQLLFVLPELNILAAENNGYMCAACQTNLKDFCIFKKVCIENYYRWKSYKNLLVYKNGVQSQKFCNMQVRIQKNIEVEKNIDDISSELAYNLHTELDIKPSQSTYYVYENGTESVNLTVDIPQLNDNNININNNELEQLPQIAQILNTVSLANNETNTNYVPGPQKPKCSQCEKVFSSKQALKKHVRTHLVIKEFNCTLCQKSFSLKRTLKDHMVVHENKRFQCDHCQKTFGYKQSLKRHTIVCVKRVQTNSTDNNEHKAKQKPKTLNKEKKKKQDDLSKISLTTIPKDLASKLKLFLNLSSASPRKFNILIQEELTEAEKTDILENMIKPAALRNELEYKCLLCNKQMYSRKRLSIHVKTHNEIKDLRCERCNKKFREHYSLYRHLKTHSNDRCYKCPLCFKDFIENHDLVRHGRFHLGIKNHECAVCKKRFTEKHSLTLHMRTHREILQLK